MKEQSSKSVVTPKNLVVDGTGPCGNFAGDGENAPFVVFDVDRQENIAGPFDTRDAGEKARAAILEGAVPMLDVAALQSHLNPDENPLTNASREIRLAVHDIVITVYSQGGGAIESSLHDDDESPEAKAALDGLESMMLAHAVAGIDVSLPAYLEGIETVVEAIWNRHDVLDRKQPEASVRDAANALLSAFGGDTPSWLRAEAAALENALAREAIANERQQSAGELFEIRRNVAQKVLDLYELGDDFDPRNVTHGDWNMEHPGELSCFVQANYWVADDLRTTKLDFRVKFGVAGNVTEAYVRSPNGKVVGKRGDARSAGTLPEIRLSAGAVVLGAHLVVGGGTPASEDMRREIDRVAVLLRDRYGMEVETRYNSNGRSGGAFLVTDARERGIDSNGSVGISAGSLDDGSLVFNVMVDEHHLSDPSLAKSGGVGMFAKYAYVRVHSVDEAMRWIEKNSKLELSNLGA